MREVKLRDMLSDRKILDHATIEKTIELLAHALRTCSKRISTTKSDDPPEYKNSTNGFEKIIISFISTSKYAQKLQDLLTTNLLSIYL